MLESFWIFSFFCFYLIKFQKLIYCFIFQSNSYDHYTAFYLLLLERLRNKNPSTENSSIPPNNNGLTKHPSLETQRRRPSNIAEQAMRKLGLGTTHQQR